MAVRRMSQLQTSAAANATDVEKTMPIAGQEYTARERSPSTTSVGVGR